jgi:hypothetical protein
VAESLETANITSVMSLTASGSYIFAGTGDLLGKAIDDTASHCYGVFRSTNNGTNWTVADSGLPPGAEIQCLAASGGTIFAGAGFGVFISTDSGTSWTEADSGLPSSGVRCFAVNGSNVFAGTSFGVYLSNNGGKSWTAFKTGMPTGPLATVVSLAVSGDIIFAANDTAGVYVASTNTGKNWIAIDSGASGGGLSGVVSLAVSGSNVFAAVPFGGIYRRPISEMTEVIAQKSQQMMFQQAAFKIFSPIHGNRPMIVECSMPHPETATFTIYELSGHEIASLGKRHLESGLHRLSLDIQNVAAGCYIMRMQTATNSLSTFFQVMR